MAIINYYTIDNPSSLSVFKPYSEQSQAKLPPPVKLIDEVFKEILQNWMKATAALLALSFAMFPGTRTITSGILLTTISAAIAASIYFAIKSLFDAIPNNQYLQNNGNQSQPVNPDTLSACLNSLKAKPYFERWKQVKKLKSDQDVLHHFSMELRFGTCTGRTSARLRLLAKDKAAQKLNGSITAKEFCESQIQHHIYVDLRNSLPLWGNFSQPEKVADLTRAFIDYSTIDDSPTTYMSYRSEKKMAVLNKDKIRELFSDAMRLMKRTTDFSFEEILGEKVTKIPETSKKEDLFDKFIRFVEDIPKPDKIITHNISFDSSKFIAAGEYSFVTERSGHAISFHIEEGQCNVYDDNFGYYTMPSHAFFEFLAKQTRHYNSRVAREPIGHAGVRLYLIKKA